MQGFHNQPQIEYAEAVTAGETAHNFNFWEKQHG